MACSFKFEVCKPREDPVDIVVSLTTFLDIRVEDVSNLGGGWKVRDLSESRIYNKDRKTKEFPENRLDSLLEWDRRPKRA
jgi:hypothetical protein